MNIGIRYNICKLQFQAILDQNGNRQKALVAILFNFPKASPTKPALLEHSQVETLFHDFGSMMHMICSKVSITATLHKSALLLSLPDQYIILSYG